MDKENQNPLMEYVFYVKAAAGLFVIFFCVANVVAFFIGETASFQRLGSLWVAILILLFGFTRFILELTKNASEGGGPFFDKFIEIFKPVTYSDDRGWLNYMSKDGQEFDRPLPTIETVSKQFSEFERHVFYVVASNEFLLAIIATLQWGYGDLFHCWVHGNGWQVCY